MKTCTHCNATKQVTEFYNKKDTKDGKMKHCKTCDKKKTALYRDNKERREKARQLTAKWNKENYERKLQMDRDYRRNNRDKANYWESVRHSDKLKRTVKWADKEAIKQKYLESQRLTKELGIPHHVDHIIPLRGKLVSGLHVEYNLQVIPAKQNLIKSNTYRF